MSVISGTVGAVLGAKSARETNAANLAAARETNDLNRQMFEQSRGASGNAFLPTYFGNFENQTLGVDARNYYQASKDALGDPWQQEFRYRTIRDQFTPQFNAANQTAADIWNGNITSQREANFAPVGASRLKSAGQQRQAINEALNARLSEIKSLNNRQGFTGDSSFQQNRLFGATLGANEQAAAAQSAAELANAGDVRGIRDAGIQLRLSNMDLPYQRAQQAIAFEQLPVDIMQTNQSRALRPFDFFRMGQTPFRYDQLPQGQNIPSAGQIALTGIGGANQQVGSYLLQKNLASQYGNAYATNPFYASAAASGYGYQLPQNYGTLTAADQAGYLNSLANASAIGQYTYD